MDALEALLRPGTILGGKYRLVRVLGRGGMGTVLLAHHVELDQPVAIKLLEGSLARDPDIVARFTREARAAVKLTSDHVVRVNDVGRFEGLGPYMVMEYLRGCDLDQLLTSRGPLAVEVAVDYLLQAIEAVAEAHAAGIIHRDLKPSNLFLAQRPDDSKVVKVLDFGISKVLDSPDKLTTTREALGSPAFMSPEQLRSARGVDERSDVWSLGVVLYELLTGALPFEGTTSGELLGNVLSVPPIPARTKRPELPPALDTAILRCLQQSPGARYRDVGELAQALAPFGSGTMSREVERARTVLRRRTSALAKTRENPIVAPTPDDDDRTTRKRPPNDPTERMARWTQRSWGLPVDTAARSRVKVVASIAVGVLAGLAVAAFGVVLLRDRSQAPAASGIAPAVEAPSITATGPVQPEPPPREAMPVPPATGAPSATTSSAGLDAPKPATRPRAPSAPSGAPSAPIPNVLDGRL